MFPTFPWPVGAGGEADSAARRRAFVVTGSVAGLLVAGVAMSVCVVLHAGTAEPGACPFAVVAGWGDLLRAIGRAAVVGVLGGALGGVAGYVGARLGSLHRTPGH